MLGQPHRRYATIDSTNDAARAWAEAGAPHGALVTAAAQTGGRGRRGRAWTSPPGQGLYFSLVLRPTLVPAQVTRLTLLAALAGARTVERQTGLAAQTKWPNDVLLHGRKIGGILCEALLDGERLSAVIVGVGLNLNFTVDDLPERPLFPASSLLLETGQAWLLEPFLQEWLAVFEAAYAELQSGGWPALRRDFEARCAGLDRAITVATETERYTGVATGIDDEGILIVQTPSGPRRVVAGDVSFSED